MKKFLSTILAVVMVLSSMAMVVSANGTEQTTGIWVGATAYTSIDAAAAAASQTTSKEITIVGTVEVASRQTIAYDGIVIEGHDGAALVASDNFKNSSETNRKAVLTIAANNVKVNNLTVDGTNYDETLASASTFDFNVVRVNSGTGIELNNVTITGSKRTLLSIGTKDNEAEVTADGLYCTAEYKSVPLNWLGVTYADVNIVNGKLTLEAGEVDGFIAEDYSLIYQYSGELDNQTSNHYRLKYVYGTRKDLISTVAHFVNSYANAKTNAQTYVSGFVNTAAYADNATTIGAMVAEAAASNDATLKANFIALLTDAVAAASNDDVKTTLNGYINQLQ